MRESTRRTVELAKRPRKRQNGPFRRLASYERFDAKPGVCSGVGSAKNGAF